MKKEFKGFVAGVLVMAALFGMIGTAGAVVGKMQANLDYNNIKISLNGTQITPKDANGNVVEPFAINGTTYLPVRAVGESLGMDVQWDGNTKTVLLSGAKSASGISRETVDKLTVYHDLYRLADNFMDLKDSVYDLITFIDGKNSGYVSASDLNKVLDNLNTTYTNCNSFAGEMIYLCPDEISIQILSNIIDAQGELVTAKNLIMSGNGHSGECTTAIMNAQIILNQAKIDSQDMYSSICQSLG